MDILPSYNETKVTFRSEESDAKVRGIAIAILVAVTVVALLACTCVMWKPWRAMHKGQRDSAVTLQMDMSDDRSSNSGDPIASDSGDEKEGIDGRGKRKRWRVWKRGKKQGHQALDPAPSLGQPAFVLREVLTYPDMSEFPRASPGYGAYPTITYESVPISAPQSSKLSKGAAVIGTFASSSAGRSRPTVPKPLAQAWNRSSAFITKDQDPNRKLPIREFFSDPPSRVSRPKAASSSYSTPTRVRSPPAPLATCAAAAAAGQRIISYPLPSSYPPPPQNQQKQQQRVMDEAATALRIQKYYREKYPAASKEYTEGMSVSMLSTVTPEHRESLIVYVAGSGSGR